MLLHVVYCIENQKQPVSIESISRNSGWSGDISLVVEGEIEQLVEKEGNKGFSKSTNVKLR